MISYKTINDQQKESLVKEFLPFIKYTAYRLAWRLPGHLTEEDLISVGTMGLLDALGRYDEQKAKLRTFVEFRIKGAMLDEIRAYDWVPKSMKKKIDAVRKVHARLEKELCRMPEEEEIAQAMDISVQEYRQILQDASGSIMLRFEDFRINADEGEMDVSECIGDKDAKGPFEELEENRLKEAIAAAIDRLPKKERMILSLYYWDELTMKEIARVLDLTEGRVSQLHKQALMRLKSRFGDTGALKKPARVADK
ncbi:MAG: FliA/WhiG family RNA polymerase sigma factor [Nitrospiraceae bacterium]|nr:FliA/WhiG family RNA polymerase sigma factor [Nitrospiraceae bacterium]